MGKTLHLAHAERIINEPHRPKPHHHKPNWFVFLRALWCGHHATAWANDKSVCPPYGDFGDELYCGQNALICPRGMDDKPNPQIISSNNDKPNWFIFYACRNATDVQPRGQTINLFAHPTQYLPARDGQRLTGYGTLQFPKLPIRHIICRAHPIHR